MRIFLTGGTGLIGPHLVRELSQRGDRVVLLTRRPDAPKQLGLDGEVVEGDPGVAGVWQDRAAGCDAIVNLAGENIIGRRWSADYKFRLRDSRVLATGLCAAALAKNPARADGTPKVLVNASAIGIYGPRGNEEIDETAPPGDDFLARLCVEWEAAAKPAMDAGVRTVFARMGVVLARDGGALKKMLLPFKLGAGGPVASGRQYLSWVHHADVVGMILFALDCAAARGPMNVTAPDSRPNKEFGKALGRALGRPAVLWTPGFALRLAMGEGAMVVTTGQRVVPRQALAWGYPFRFPNLDAALADILR